jgi:hypothetical protein
MSYEKEFDENVFDKNKIDMMIYGLFGGAGNIPFREELFLKEREIMVNKAKDYSNNGNRFANFEEAAYVLDTYRELICLSYLMKHICAIANGVKQEDLNWCWQNEDGSEGFKQRIADARNYLLLLGEMIEDGVNQNNEENKGEE